ncbi:MAG: hypothetical protein WKF89_15975 [Chitinophagaceae bacterium]
MKKFAIFAAFAFILSSCEKAIDWGEILHQGSKSNTYSGPQVKMGNGMARSWIITSHKGVPTEIGVEMTDEVLYGLPATNFSIAIPLHSKAKETTPFDHLYITWAAQGHPLPGTFIGPHLDVRFFMTSLEEHLAIPSYAVAPAGFDNHPPKGYLPVSYFPDAPVPQLGLHWTDKNFTDPVTKTMILGSYDGKFTFISPIMILPVLQSGQRYSSSYSQPQYFAKKNTYYPTKYSIYLDNTTKKHYVSLSDFVWR